MDTYENTMVPVPDTAPHYLPDSRVPVQGQQQTTPPPPVGVPVACGHCSWLGRTPSVCPTHGDRWDWHR
jgi:hypothetical protein